MKLEREVKRTALITDLVVLVLCLFCLGCPVGPIDPDIEPDPDPTVIFTDEELAEIQPILDRLEPVADAELAAFYDAYADVVERDNEVIATTEQFRTGHVRSLTLMFQRTDMIGKHPPEVAENIDAALMAALDKQNVTMDEQHRRKAVAILESIADAVR